MIYSDILTSLVVAHQETVRGGNVTTADYSVGGPFPSLKYKVYVRRMNVSVA